MQGEEGEARKKAQVRNEVLIVTGSVDLWRVDGPSQIYGWSSDSNKMYWRSCAVAGEKTDKNKGERKEEAGGGEEL